MSRCWPGDRRFRLAVAGAVFAAADEHLAVGEDLGGIEETGVMHLGYGGPAGGPGAVDVAAVNVRREAIPGLVAVAANDGSIAQHQAVVDASGRLVKQRAPDPGGFSAPGRQQRQSGQQEAKTRAGNAARTGAIFDLRMEGGADTGWTADEDFHNGILPRNYAQCSGCTWSLGACN